MKVKQNYSTIIKIKKEYRNKPQSHYPPFTFAI